MRIGHCRLESRTGDFDANLAKVVKGLERADKERVEVVCFPECFLPGYEDFIFVDIDPAVGDKAWGVGKSLWSAREFHKHLLEVAGLQK